MALSSTKAEYMAASKVTMEIIFIADVIKFLGMKVEYPIKVHVDNMGAIYLSKTASSGNRTKHINTRYHFVRERIEDGILQVEFVPSEENVADIMMKNLNQELFNKHSSSLFGSVIEMPNRKGIEE